jgi:uncharacterized protein (TIGR03435 family)
MITAVFRIAALSALAAFPALPQSFAVASVKPSAPDARERLAIQPGGRFVCDGVQLGLLISLAWHATPFRMSGADGWIANDRWNIEATSEGVSELPPWSPPNLPEAMAVRLRSLLEERFSLKVHRETRPRQVYALTVGKNGDKLFRAAAASGSFRAGPGVVIGSAVTMDQFVVILSRLMDREVIDRSGLTGRFDIELRYAPESAPRSLSAAPEPGTSAEQSIFVALEEQLGLKLQSAKEPAEFLVIDSARKPADN